MNVRDLKRKCLEIKLECLEMCIKAGEGHVTSAFSCAEIVTALYYDIMNYDVCNPDWENRDRFIMSKNHASVITYPILRDLGFINDNINFLENGSIYGAHSKREVPGVEFSGGSLGIGLGVAAGMAYAAKMDKQNYRIFALVGDGECYEGSIWESIMFAGHNKLGNLIMFIDRNNMSILDFTENALKLNPLDKKIEAFNWDVKTIDGHDIESIISAVRDKKDIDSPLCIICNTIKGNGISSMSNRLYKHGTAPKGDEAEDALNEMRERLQNENE